MERGTCGKNLTWTLDDGTLTISGTGEMYNYFTYTVPWYSSRKLIRKVVLEVGVTTIGDWAFCACKNLMSVIIPDSVTTMGSLAFRCCTSLTNVIIPDSVTTIGAYAFDWCTGLTSVIIPDNVTTIRTCAFNWCTGLTSVIIPDSVTTIGSFAFRNCKSLTSVIIPDSVTTIGRFAFSDCKSLTSVIIPDFVTTIGAGVFSGCKNLTSVKIPGSVTTIGAKTFYHCKYLKEIYYKCGTKIDLNSLTVGNNAELIPYDELPLDITEKEPDKPKDAVEKISPPAETNCTVYKNTKISRAENIAPPNTKSLSRVDENIAEIRRAAELAAMNIVMTIERDLGFSPEDVSSQNLGYDIKSTSHDGKISRLIEVKGRYVDAESVTVSRNEIDAALNNPENFILAIVRLNGGKNETFYIRKPFEQPPDRAALSVNFNIQKLVEVSEIVPG